MRRVGITATIKDEVKFEEFLHDLNVVEVRAETAANEFVHEAAEKLRRKIQDNIAFGRPEWPELSMVTKALKGSEQPLRDSGELLLSIQVQHLGNTALVGIPDGTVRTDGTPMDVVADILEHGAAIRVTDKMRGFLASKGFPLKRTTETVVIPPRRFFEPAVREWRDELVKDLEELGKKVVG